MIASWGGQLVSARGPAPWRICEKTMIYKRGTIDVSGLADWPIYSRRAAFVAVASSPWPQNASKRHRL